jgi:hypothetical protein
LLRDDGVISGSGVLQFQRKIIMKKITFLQAYFWAKNALRSFLRNITKTEISISPSGRDHTVFSITQDSHPSKVDRWIRRGGGDAMTPQQLAKAAARHIHPRSLRPNVVV